MAAKAKDDAAVCRIMVTQVLSMHPYREMKRNCKLKVTHDDLCTRHWNEIQERQQYELRQVEERAERERKHEQNNQLRIARGAEPLEELANYSNEGALCSCGHERGDHAFSMCNHMWVDHPECYYDMCDHCTCRKYEASANAAVSS